MNPPPAVPLDNEFIISFFRLRQALGYIGIAMPIVVKVGAYVVDKVPSNTSISAYYYTSLRDVFVGCLTAIGVFLFCYRGPDKQDNWLTNIAGLCAIGIGLFPTEPTYHQVILDRCPNVLDGPCYEKHLLGYHFYLAAAFFLIISYLAVFRFKKPSRPYITKQKETRNKIYVICGIAMFLSLVAIALIKLFSWQTSIFAPEAVAIVAFGIAWLTKGQAFLKDKDIITASAA